MEVGQERCVPAIVAELEATEVALAVGGINSDDPKIIEFSRDYPALVVWVAILVICQVKLGDEPVG